MYHQRHTSSRPQAVATAILLGITFLILYSFTLSSHSSNNAYNNLQQPFDNEFPRKIWQTWQTFEDGSQDLSEENQRLSKTWTDLNREHRYELLKSGSASTYVRDHFKDQPDIIETFERLGDPILRADLIRYLTLLAEGGVYSDIDTDCSRPIRDWIPAEYLNKSNLVLGIEYDARGQEVREDLKAPVQLCQWTLMSKPGHPVIQHLLNRVVAKVKTLGEGQSDILPQNVDDVLESTGPRVFTSAVLEALTARTGKPVTYKELSYVDSPRLIGDVLILPISAFASGQDHPASKPWGNEEQLISHHWKGFEGWRSRLGG
ncbi:hypothetical protein PRZ48_009929 [Zasmidium cellare]|uniref:Uncharacterized protein n=1 Tax=Zasmidium cellare TaxID=395010 RepID=A0ABR0ED31_ZASCE|nr:hypothetical protein PRZ48_009929 [Zasmidium cellare]